MTASQADCSRQMVRSKGAACLAMAARGYFGTCAPTIETLIPALPKLNTPNRMFPRMGFVMAQ